MNNPKPIHRLVAVAFTLAVGASAITASGPAGPTDTTHLNNVVTTAAVGAGDVPVTREFDGLGLETSPHAAFPAATRLPDGRVLMTWRESAGHLATDGVTMSTVGDPLAGTWSTPTELTLDTSSPTRDMRPAMLSTIDGVVWLTYFYWENGTPSGAFVTKSTNGGVSWSPSVRVDGGRPYAAISSPVVKVAGRLVTAWYGRNAGEAVDTAWVSWSTNGGASWATNRIANGIGANHAFPEPFALARGNTLMVLMRDGSWSGLGMRTSPDGGVTWTPNVVHILDNATGNPAATWTSNGNIYLVYRHTVTRDAMIAVSKNSGASWQAEPAPLLRAPANLGAGSLGMVYAAPVDLGDGRVFCPIGMERSLTSARIFTGWL